MDPPAAHRQPKEKRPAPRFPVGTVLALRPIGPGPPQPSPCQVFRSGRAVAGKHQKEVMEGGAAPKGGEWRAEAGGAGVTGSCRGLLLIRMYPPGLAAYWGSPPQPSPCQVFRSRRPAPAPCARARQALQSPRPPLCAYAPICQALQSSVGRLQPCLSSLIRILTSVSRACVMLFPAALPLRKT